MKRAGKTDWAKHHQDQKKSGLSVKDYSALHGFHPSSLYTYRRKEQKPRTYPFVAIEPAQKAKLPKAAEFKVRIDESGEVHLSGHMLDLSLIKELLGGHR